VTSQAPDWLADLAASLRRDADVPVGVQLAWALRARVVRGDLRPGDRLPPLRLLAEETSLNVNTVRAVYARLEHEGLLDSRHGSGTFVSAGGDAHAGLGAITERAARAAERAGLDVRDVAAALYMRTAEATAA
jgi:DNA-binding transcriptional regulator YhcF (GntR family)